jgi:DnaK suppressor protein
MPVRHFARSVDKAKARKKMSLDLERIKAQLEAKRAELQKSLQELITASASAEHEEANRDPTDREEEAIDVNETQDTWFVRLNQQQLLAEVEEALGRIEQGTYGLCVRCHQPIPEKRLLNIPWAARDVTCQEQHDAQELIIESSDRPLQRFDHVEPPFSTRNSPLA